MHFGAWCCFCTFFHVQPKHQDGASFVNIDYPEHRNRGSTCSHRASLTAKRKAPLRPARAHTAATLAPRHHAGPARRAPRESPQIRRRSISRSHRTAARARTLHCAGQAPRLPTLRRRQQQRRQRQTSRTNDDERRRKDYACPNKHNARDADRWGTATLGVRPGNGVSALFLP